MESSSAISSLTAPKNRPWPAYLWRMLRHPFSASREIAAWDTIRPGLVIVLVLGLYLAIGSTISYLQHDYPPPVDEMAVWIQTWGEFNMLPVINIPLEQYRLFMAIISLPVVFGAWMLAAGSARLLARLFHGSTNFDQYLNLFAFSFFPFWLLSGLGDAFFSSGLKPWVIPALRGEYGPLVRGLFYYYPPLLYTLLFGLGGLYSGLAAYSAGRLRWWQAIFTGLTTFAWPLLFASTLYR